jgi:hypothetical protein
MEMYLFVHKGPYRSANSDRYLATLFCAQEEFKLSARLRASAEAEFMNVQAR